MAANNLELDFSCGVVSQILADKTKLNCMMSTHNMDAVVRNFDVMSFLGSMSVDQVDSGEITVSEISSNNNYNIVVSRDCFKYLGSQVAADGGCERDVVHRMNEGCPELGKL